MGSNVQFIWAVDWLCYSVPVLQVGRHLERIDVDVGGLPQSHQLPQRHSEGPLRKAHRLEPRASICNVF